MSYFYYSLFILIECIGIYAAVHAVFQKQNPGAAFSWIIVTICVPILGPCMYYLFGISRLKKKALKLKGHHEYLPDHDDCKSFKTDEKQVEAHFYTLAKLSSAVTNRSLLSGNSIQALTSGEELYPQMLNDINSAKNCIYLSTYIFDTDKTGREFISALAQAQQRGVNVKVLIDSYGETFQFPWASTLLKRNNIDTACFLPIFPIPRINLRSHKKILIIDGVTAYTGGMNISHRHIVDNENIRKWVIDCHFRLRGPIVSQIENEFIADWHFATDNLIDDYFKLEKYQDNVLCRVISDGPDNDIDIFIETLSSAFSTAQHSIKIITPYFIPTLELISSLNVAALRGVNVEILLPSKSDLPYINWASLKILPELLKHNVKIYYQPPPFVHTKLILVDDYYAQIGTVNLDPRSLKLNFELAVEIYDKQFGKLMSEYFNNGLKQSKAISLDDINNRHYLLKLRDAFFWLFSPYL